MSLFLFIRYFIGAILSKKSCQKRGVQKKDKTGGGGGGAGGGVWPYLGVGVSGRGFKPAHYAMFLKYSTVTVQ